MLFELGGFKLRSKLFKKVYTLQICIDHIQSKVKKTANQVYIYFTVLGAAIKCKQLCSLLILTFPKTGKYDDWKIFCWFFGRFEDTNATFHKKGP